MARYIKVLFAALLLLGCTPKDSIDNFTAYVDPKIGTGGHGHVFVGANVPFGLVQLGPTSIPQEWDWCSGYHDSDSTVIGFSHTHLSGTGIGDLFDVTVMPVVGEVTFARGTEDDQTSGLWSYADRTREIARPGYYSVPLTRYGITAEMTATNRVGLHRYTFPKSEESAIVIDLQNGGCWDKPTETFIEACGDNAVQGYRYSKGWANAQRIYFYAEFSKPFDDIHIHSIDYMPLFAKADFNTTEGEKVLMKVGLSPVSIEGARANMAAELPGWDFEAVASAADEAWNAELGRISVDTADETAKKIFYTALYHSMFAPATFCDVDGKYRGADGDIYENPGYTTYTTFSLWDTYRAAMPLYSIFQSERYPELINTMLSIYKEQGKLPVWHLHGCETDCMVGNPGIPPVADAIVKGFEGFDYELAFEAMKVSALRPDRGQDARMKYGYIPYDKFNESVAYDLEYALADGALANAAKVLGKEEDYQYFFNRSKSYVDLFDHELRFIRGKDSKGRFRTEYSPFASAHRADDYCEGNGWQYTWLVPHDFRGLVSCFGSKEEFLVKLDSLFTVPSVIEGAETSPDISGLIGQYAHGNEPSHHILYFYAMAGQPWKTADKVREVLSTLYSAEPDGLSGNEDVGQMSSWYILSALGFYEVEPASGRYWFGSPVFDKAEIAVDGGTFTITTEGNSDKNRYIQSITLNGKAYTKGYLEHKDIAAGGELVIKMGAEPKVWYCAEEPLEYEDQRPLPEDRLFTSKAVEDEIARVVGMLENPRLKWMFANCYPNTLDTTVHPVESEDGLPDTFVYTGDIPAMWLRDSGAQVWPYLRYVNEDPELRKMIAGVIRRQFKCICVDPYANAFNVEPLGAHNKTDWPEADPYVFERKWEIDSHCYPIRLAYEYWKKSGDETVFDAVWHEAMGKIVATLKEQQRKEGHGSYVFLRTTDRQLDTKCVVGRGNPVNPVGLIASAFRPSDDATTFEFLVPSNFMAVTSLRKAAEILREVNNDAELAQECLDLASEVEQALKEHAVCEHPEYGKIYAFEVDGFGSQFLMDDANVPSLLAMSYLGDVPADDPVYQNTRKFVWSEANPYFHRGPAGEGIGGPHIWSEVIWPMSIMMRAFTSDSDEEIQHCICQLMTTDAGTGFMHESFHKDNAEVFTREWFAWQNTLFGELILKIIDDGRLHVLNNII
ncbi:MAG: metal-independent alpha-mannosidase [Bacteroidales bacterium]|nr:metal-independent alpha-mannosidase [Bacteroidales bacterium]